jgi:chaperonin GroEL (HSP60 family)
MDIMFTDRALYIYCANHKGFHKITTVDVPLAQRFKRLANMRLCLKELVSTAISDLVVKEAVRTQDDRIYEIVTELTANLDDEGDIDELTQKLITQLKAHCSRSSNERMSELVAEIISKLSNEEDINALSLKLADHLKQECDKKESQPVPGQDI